MLGTYPELAEALLIGKTITIPAAYAPQVSINNLRVAIAREKKRCKDAGLSMGDGCYLRQQYLTNGDLELTYEKKLLNKIPFTITG